MRRIIVAPPTECMMIYEKSTSGEFGDYFFGGTYSDSDDFDTPFFWTADATGEPAGRVLGQYFSNEKAINNPGNCNVHFFEDDYILDFRP
jgi:hypothetical protein